MTAADAALVERAVTAGEEIAEISRDMLNRIEGAAALHQRSATGHCTTGTTQQHPCATRLILAGGVR